MNHILDDTNSPTRHPIGPAVDWERGIVRFETDGTESKGEPDTYTILATYYWAVIDGKIHVDEINARAIALDRQPDTVEEHVRNHLQFTVFNEPIEFL